MGVDQPVALGGPKTNCMALMSANIVAWQPLSGDAWELKELDSYESPIKDAYLHDVVAGDLNNDGRKDLVFIETAKHYLDLVVFDAANHIVPSNRWPVFEERSLRGSRSELPEPREAVIADVTGDGKNDLMLVNNSRAKINILYNQTGRTNPPAAKKGVKREINELPPDARFRIESIASEKRIAALIVKDLNCDGRPDLAYYGEPKELIVQYNQGTNGWAAPKRWPIEDGALSANALSEGDLNGDGRTDLLLLSEKYVYCLAQKADGTFAEPTKTPLSSTARAAQAVDVNGDGRKDLLLVNWESVTPFRFRLQNAAGQLGPELYFNFPAIRSYAADNLTTNGGTQIMTIALNSGRAQISQFTRKPAAAMTEDFREGQLQVLPLTSTDKSRRGIVWGDVDGDGFADLLTAEPESGQLSLYLQKSELWIRFLSEDVQQRTSPSPRCVRGRSAARRETTAGT